MICTLPVQRSESLVQGTIADAVTLARQTGRPAFFSHAESLSAPPDPMAFLAASSRELGGGILWLPTRGGLAIAGAGSAIEFRYHDAGRFSATSAALRDLPNRLIRNETEARFPIFGGFAFSEQRTDSPVWRDFPAALLVVPQVLVQAEGAATRLRVTVRVDPGSPPGACAARIERILRSAREWTRRSLGAFSVPTPVARRAIPARDAWESSVATARAVIRQGMVDKVVLAREERILADGMYSPIATLARLRAADASTTLFAMQSGSSWFIGATPERLVRLDGQRVDVSCLAGSIAIGAAPAERQRLAEALLSSAKDREEHEIVVRSTISALAEVCEDVARLVETPRVVSAGSVQHLETRLIGKLSSAGHVLDLVERLHPTPAVGGYPRERAMNLIRELEEIDRGWYAGPIGWFDLDGSGEFAVAIRSALLNGNAASVFAGSGIVADSVPGNEFEETCLKLRPMLAALGSA